jgi:transposase
MPRGTQVIKGVEYVFETMATWNAEKKYGTHKRVYIGKMVDGAFVPNKRYTLQCQLEQSEKEKPGPVPVTTSTRLFSGTTYLLDEIGRKLGITEDLETCFPDTWKQILSIAYYLVLEDTSPLSRFPRWAASHRHPAGANIPSQRSSELFAGITEHAKQQFFKLQTQRRTESEYLAYDTTSVSSYSRLIKQVKYGKNKDHDPLPQINLALLFGESSRLPVYYRKLPGNINDVATVRRLLADISFLITGKVKLVMDRGFYSEANINSLYHKHYKFLVGTKVSLSFVQNALEEVRESMKSRSHYNSQLKLHHYTKMIDWNYSSTSPSTGETETGTHRMYLHLFYNEQRAVDDKEAFNSLLDDLESELKQGTRNKDHEKLYRKYYDISETPVRGLSFTPKQDAIEEAEKNYGYFVLISNDIKDAIEAIEVYRTKDVVEKAFGNLKERLNLRRTSVSSEQNLEGKIFVQFVALMFLSRISRLMSTKGLYKDYTLQGLLDELDVMESFEHPGTPARYGEITKKQQELYRALEVDVPA